MRGTTFHQRACESLAEHLAGQGYRAWVEVRRVGVQSYGDAGRVDVAAMMPWSGRSTFDLVAFEVKVQRSDLLNDVRNGKWRRYVDEYHVPRVGFATWDTCPAEMSDIPGDAGWFAYDGKAWRRKRAPRVMERDQRKLDPLFLLSLLSTPPTSFARENRDRWAALHAALPARIREVIDGMPDKDVARGLYHRAGRQIGHEIRRRLEKDKGEKQAVETWALKVLGLCARVEGVDVEQLRSDVKSEYHETLVEKALERAMRLATHQRDLARLVGGIEGILVDGWSNDEHIESSLATLREIEEHRRKRDDAEHEAPKRRSKAS